MVQMGDNASCHRAMSNLMNCYIFNSKMTLGSVHVFCTGQLFMYHVLKTVSRLTFSVGVYL